MIIDMLKSTALGTCLSLVLVLPAAAQDTTSSGNGGGTQSEGSTGQTSQSDQSADTAQSGQSEQSIAPEAVVALVGETEILGADVIDFVAALPPRMREQPPQMLMSMAVDQVILRELLLQEARSQNLAEDPRVAEIVERNTAVAEEDAMVAVYLQDQLSQRIDDAAIQQAYEQVEGQLPDGQSLPPLEELRPQIEQQLQQQALQSLRQELASGVDVVVYGAGETTAGSGTDGSGSEGEQGANASDSK